MSNNEVMKLEEDKDLKGEFKELCKALRNNHRINPNLYVEYDVKRDCVIQLEKESCKD